MQSDTSYKVGILALQGAVSEHIAQLQALGVQAIAVKKVTELTALDGLILPGGESTAIGKLMRESGFIDAIRQFAGQGKAIFATCAGMILLAKEIVGGEATHLALMDIAVQRNAFGRQIDSFQSNISVCGLQEVFPAIFIRAPYVQSILSDEVEVLAQVENHPVLVKQGNLLACSFHPELSQDSRIMQIFLTMMTKS